MAKRSPGRDISGENNPAHKRTGYRSVSEIRTIAAKFEEFRVAFLAVHNKLKAAGLSEVKIDGNLKVDLAILKTREFLKAIKREMVNQGLEVDDVVIPD